MIVIAGLVAGALLGWLQAGRLGGNRKDRMQYALVYAMIGGVLGLLTTIVIGRTLSA